MSLRRRAAAASAERMAHTPVAQGLPQPQGTPSSCPLPAPPSSASLRPALRKRAAEAPPRAASEPRAVRFSRRPAKPVGTADAGVDRTPHEMPPTCDGCANYILGRRWSCAACAAEKIEDFDLCGTCFDAAPASLPRPHQHELGCFTLLGEEDVGSERHAASSPELKLVLEPAFVEAAREAAPAAQPAEETQPEAAPVGEGGAAPSDSPEEPPVAAAALDAMQLNPVAVAACADDRPSADEAAARAAAEEGCRSEGGDAARPG